jgi:2-oxoglutarate ferredoxin oxidoreductase subunit gamma
MEKKIIIAGFGGQGVILAGQILAHSGMMENKKVTLVPAYGPEMRGGTANCTVILKDSEIYSSVVSNPDIMIALNQPSINRFEDKVSKGGCVIYNSTLCKPEKNRKELKYIGIPATDLAHEIGNPKVANAILLGALLKATGILKPETISEKTLPALLTGRKSAFIEINRTALESGYNCEVKTC